AAEGGCAARTGDDRRRRPRQLQDRGVAARVRGDREIPRGARSGDEDVEPLTLAVSTAHSRIVYDALKQCGVRLISALPETWLVHLIRMAEDDPAMTLVRLAKQEEGVGISAAG